MTFAELAACLVAEVSEELGDELAEVVVAAAVGMALLELFADGLERIGLTETAGALRLMLPAGLPA